MKVKYDAEVDVLHIVLSHAPIEESDEEKPGGVVRGGATMRYVVVHERTPTG